MYQQVYDPIAGNLALSAIVAVIPIVVLFVLLAGIRLAAQWAALITLAVALVIAVVVYGMPAGLAIDSALFGAAFGLFPIVWIVINATFPKHKYARVAIQHSAARRRNTTAPPDAEYLDADTALAFS